MVEAAFVEKAVANWPQDAVREAVIKFGGCRLIERYKADRERFAPLRYGGEAPPSRRPVIPGDPDPALAPEHGFEGSHQPTGAPARDDPAAHDRRGVGTPVG